MLPIRLMRRAHRRSQLWEECSQPLDLIVARLRAALDPAHPNGVPSNRLPNGSLRQAGIEAQNAKGPTERSACGLHQGQVNTFQMEKSLHISAETLDFCSEANPLADALKFFVEFAQADLEQLAPRGWDELREKLTTVLGTKRQNAKRTALRMSPRSRVDIRVLKRPFPWAYPEEEFRTLQCEIQGLLKRAVDGRGGMAKLSEDVAIAAGHDPASERKVLEIVGSVRGAALMVLVMELWRESGAPIRRCPECDRLFYRVRKQRYCNRSCVNAANMRTWLKTAKGQRYLAKKYDAGGWQRGKRKPRTTRHRRVEFGFVDLSKVVG